MALMRRMLCWVLIMAVLSVGSIPAMACPDSLPRHVACSMDDATDHHQLDQSTSSQTDCVCQCGCGCHQNLDTLPHAFNPHVTAATFKAYFPAETVHQSLLVPMAACLMEMDLSPPPKTV
ncbi:MAG: hypothetical protein D6703_04125 [Zetaproteobacteria bacterium]|nr:MAG: hypothetical protein D6703_04125 [Zetaproteobacteria bacterium]